MDITLTAQTTAPFRDSLAPMMADYYALMVAKFTDAGGPDIDRDGLIDEIWADMDPYLPPQGQIFLAHAHARAGDRLVGCGFLRRIRSDAAELKRLYVLPDCQGQGLGRRLIEARIDGARDMGLRDLYTDTVTGNGAMLRLYDRLGFRRIERYPENANPPERDPWLVYLHRPVG
jgi:GNAT superfamily N-acetyltransferase